VENCTFYDNAANSTGGGIRCDSSSANAVANCLFYGNSAQYGGGLYDESSSSLAIANCTFHTNTASYGKALWFGNDSGIAVTNSIVWATGGDALNANATAHVIATYSDVLGGYTGTANISLAPQFLNAIGKDFRLASTSPCVDSGTADGAPAMDALGVARPQGAGVDMGAYEFAPAVGAPVAAFQANVLTGTVPLTVQFTDESTEGGSAIASWIWDFGDGHSSRASNPTHTYDSIGTYTVALTVENSTEGDTEVKTSYISVLN
jgi:PKD repeat protein